MSRNRDNSQWDLDLLCQLFQTGFNLPGDIVAHTGVEGDQLFTVGTVHEFFIARHDLVSNGLHPTLRDTIIAGPAETGKKMSFFGG